MSFWNSRPTHQTDGQAILFRENFEGEIQNIKNDVVGRIYSFTFNLCKQSIQIINIYGPNKPYQSLTNYITNAKNMIIGGGFNMVEDFKDRTGSSICNTNLVGSEPLTKLIQCQNDTEAQGIGNETNPFYHMKLFKQLFKNFWYDWRLQKTPMTKFPHGGKKEKCT